MKLNSLWRFVKGQGARKPRGRKAKLAGRNPGLALERLEAREMLSSTPPTIVAVTPPDGSTSLSTHPQLSIRFSEAVDAGAVNPANYLLVSGSGQIISVDSASFVSPSDNQVNLLYNGGQSLPADTYTLFVHGDQIHDTTPDDQPLSVPTRLAVANTGQQNVSIVNLPGNGSLQAISNYAASSANAQPTAVSLSDINGDGVPDLIVAEASTDQLDVFLGLAGGGFQAKPAQTLPLGSGAKPAAMVVTDLNGDGYPDIAVADSGTNSITVFLNLHGTFTAGNTYAAGNDPVGIVSADFDGDGQADLAVVDSKTDIHSQFDLTVLLGDPRNPGKFLAGTAFNAGITSPTGIAVGDLNQDGSPDVAISAMGGSRIMFDHSSGKGTASFIQGPVLTTLPTTAVAVGKLDLSGRLDVVSTTANNNGEALVFQNLGSGFFSTATTFASNPNPTAVAVADLNGDGKSDIVITNGATSTTGQIQPGQVSVLLNKTTSTVNFAAPAAYTVDSNPVALALALNKSGEVSQVATANLNGNDASVLLAKGDGTLFVSTDITLAQLPPAVIVSGDLNGDNVPDIVIGNLPNPLTFSLNDSVTIVLSQPGGGYGQPITINVGRNSFQAPFAMALGDLTGTGKEDILVTNPDDGSVTILANNGQGDFSALPEIMNAFPLGSTPTGLVVADFNNDGKADVAVSTDTGVSIMLGNGDRTFQPAVLDVIPVDALAMAALDFNGDGTTDLAVLDATGNVDIYLGNGDGTFQQLGSYAAGQNPTTLAVGDFNNDGFPDIVVANSTTPVNNVSDLSVSVLLNISGTGLSQPITTPVLQGTSATIQSVVVANLNDDQYADLVLSLTSGYVNNLVTLLGAGDAAFSAPRYYSTDGGGTTLGPSYITVMSNSLIRATTFNVVSTTVSTNLITNGGFDTLDLAGEHGNLDGWQTYQETGSAGAWAPQTGAFSPLSGTSVAIPPQGSYAAMLDQPYVAIPSPFFGFAFTNGPVPQQTDYSGMHILYQDFTVPADASSVTLTFQLYIDNTDELNTFGDTNGFSDPTLTPQLDYFPNQGSNPTPNQQVRIDIVNPKSSLTDVRSGVLANIYQTTPETPSLVNYITVTANISQFAGQTLRLRLAEVNNQGRLIVGLDNVDVDAVFNDTAPPTLASVALRNPGYGETTTFGGTTADPTIVGKVSDLAGASNIAYIEISPNNDGFNKPDNFKITTATGNLDALGNFQFTLPRILPNGQALLPGPISVGVLAVDKAGNSSAPVVFTFDLQGPSTTAFQSNGPGPINYAGQGDDFTTVSGTITSIALDPRDPNGNIIYAGSDNGGVWKSLDGGQNWTPLTDYITDPTLGNVPESISAIAVSPTQPDTVFAATGIANNEPTSSPGIGILKSTNDGSTWTVVGESVFRNARISTLVIAPADANGIIRIYAAVASGGQFGAGIYLSTDGGTTWSDVMVPSTMFLDAGGTVKPGTALASATDLVLDAYNSEILWAGLGNIGLLSPSSTAGVWLSTDYGASWQQIVGGHDPKNAVVKVLNQVIPSGVGVGKVTLALPPVGSPGNEGIVYVMMTTPGVGAPFNDGTSLNPDSDTLANSDIGVYKTSNNGLSWTHVMLKEYDPLEPNFKPGQIPFYNLFTMGNEGSDVGALAVDPTDPDVFYIGGSTRFLYGNDPQTWHGLIRVDTSDMRDTNYISPFYAAPTAPNDGDDIDKAYEAAVLGNNKEPGKYPGGAGYAGEGVSWYDLQSGDYGQQYFDPGFIPTRLVPATVYSLKFDSDGRLLVGTAGGIWRGVSQGFAYDLTSGGAGILGFEGVPTPAEGGMTFTSLNGNLQIADMTSVAIDPYNASILDSTEANTGWTQSTGALQWISTLEPSTISAGAKGFFDGFAFDAPDSGPVVTAPAVPNAPPGTQATVYRVHAIVDYLDSEIEKSTQGGAPGTFVPAVNGLPLSNIRSSIFLPLAINPTIQVDSNGNYQDQLLFWSSQIYETNDSGVSWDPITPGGPGTFPSDGSLVTAMAFSPSGTNVLWVGTSSGKVYVTTNNGGDGFPQRTSGLPSGEAVESIEVDPNNPDLAYVMLAGFGTGLGHVFETTNAGVSWTNVTGNLPDVPAYSMAIDDRTLPGTTGPRLYLGTGVGVFVSENGGKTWTPLGQVKNANGTTTETLPNVPVTSVQFNAHFEELVVATLGRGAFTISTNAYGPRVVSVSPTTPSEPGFSAITVTFNEAVDPRTFTLSQVDNLSGPNGPITPLSIIDLNPGTNTAFQITFAAQTQNGTYTLTIGPNIKDFTGLEMDQNQNGVPGEVPGDQYTAQFAVSNTDVGRFISGVYHNLLNRQVDTSGFLVFSSYVNAANFAALPPIALAFVTSAEYEADTIYNPNNDTGLYASLLRRGPGDVSQAEINFWLQTYAVGGENAVIVGLASSAEYYDQPLVGANDTGFVQQLYLDLLSRPADNGGLANFVGQLSQSEQVVRSQVVNSLDQSAEYHQVVVQTDYQKYLRRAPSAAELAFWTAQIQSGMTDEQFVASLVSSTEYYNDPKVTTSDTPNGTNGTNVTWLEAIYQDLLGRSIDPGAESTFLAQLAAGVSRSSIALSIVASTEYRTDLVQSFYERFLGRAGDPGGVAGFVNMLAHGATDEAVISQFVSSAEFYNDQSGSAITQAAKDQSWLNAAYLQILKRPVDGSGITTFLGGLAAAESAARVGVVTAFVNSQEYLQNLITQTYETYLHRAPGSGDFAIWLPFLEQPSAPGTPSVRARFIAGVLGSAEYFYLQEQPNATVTDVGWLTSLYNNLLGRAPDPAGLQGNLANLLNISMPQRTAVALTIDNSTEYNQDFVTSAYQTYLRRSPGAAEVAAGVAAIAGGETQEQFISGLVSSTEYFQNPNLGNLSNSTWLNQIYLDLLGRDRDTSSDYFLNELNSGAATLADVANGIIASTEYRDRLVNSYYESLLGRNAAPSELAAWVNAINAGTSNQDIIATIIGSNEYFEDGMHTFP